VASRDDGQKNEKTGSFADLRLNIHPAVVLFGNGKDGGQAQTGAFADGFGGEERIEDARQNLGWNADSSVADRQSHIISGTGVWICPHVIGSQLHSLCCNG